VSLDLFSSLQGMHGTQGSCDQPLMGPLYALHQVASAVEGAVVLQSTVLPD